MKTLNDLYGCKLTYTKYNYSAYAVEVNGSSVYTLKNFDNHEDCYTPVFLDELIHFEQLFLQVKKGFMPYGRNSYYDEVLKYLRNAVEFRSLISKLAKRYPEHINVSVGEKHVAIDLFPRADSKNSFLTSLPEELKKADADKNGQLAVQKLLEEIIAISGYFDSERIQSAAAVKTNQRARELLELLNTPAND